MSVNKKGIPEHSISLQNFIIFIWKEFISPHTSPLHLGRSMRDNPKGRVVEGRSTRDGPQGLVHEGLSTRDGPRGQSIRVWVGVGGGGAWYWGHVYKHLNGHCDQAKMAESVSLSHLSHSVCYTPL